MTWKTQYLQDARKQLEIVTGEKINEGLTNIFRGGHNLDVINEQDVDGQHQHHVFPLQKVNNSPLAKPRQIICKQSYRN